MRKKVVAGNWKMNTSVQEGVSLAKSISERLEDLTKEKEVIVCPPFTHLTQVVEATQSTPIRVGAQNCHLEEKGAYTGEVSANMLKSIGISYCLVGHSERRMYSHENDSELTQKLKQLLMVGIQPIFCCGESLEERKRGEYLQVIEQQLALLWQFSEEELNQVIIAYEPVWAIGTGETATAEQAQEIHEYIRGIIKKQKGDGLAQNTTILYGGSCKPNNAKELFGKSDVDGGLIGGASLSPDDFLGIINSFN